METHSLCVVFLTLLTTVARSYAAVCPSGWGGLNCNFCTGHVRLTGSSGVVVDHIGGNWYKDDSQCLVLIEANSSVTISVNSVDLECDWDFLHVFDGDSVFSPKLGAFTGHLDNQLTVDVFTNGTVPRPPQQYREPLEVILTSSQPYLVLYFYSDANSGGSGINISYWLDDHCPLNCSGNGLCERDGSCVCSSGWTGEFCQTPNCPNDCSGNGKCNLTTGYCVCSSGYLGLDCSISQQLPHWKPVTAANLDLTHLNTSELARSSHSVVVWNDYMIVFGGYQFTEGNGTTGISSPQLLRYNLKLELWEALISNSSVQPDPRYGHTSVLYNDTMYVFGGTKLATEKLTNELWALDLATTTWALIGTKSTNNSSDAFLPIAVRSHTAHVVGTKMVVLFGLTYVENSYVQEFDFTTQSWFLVAEVGNFGCVGHSSAFSAKTGLIYVVGGGVASGLAAPLLFSYNPVNGTLHNLDTPNTAITGFYLHSAVLIGDLLLTYGGCGATSPSRCFQNTLHVYNIVCGQWMDDRVVQYPGLPGSASRYGHTMVLDPFSSSVVVFGGYNGVLLGDVFRLYLGGCEVFKSVKECVNGSVLCGWSLTRNQCISAYNVSSDISYNCTNDECIAHQSCVGCEASPGCTWSAGKLTCIGTRTKTSPRNCSAVVTATCSSYVTCYSCFAHGCAWNGVCVPQNASSPVAPSCPMSCAHSDSCQACTSSPSCTWCPSLQRCASSYPLTFPYGQCLGWAKTCPATCASYQTCSQCTADPRCGWCSDPSNTGLGTCSEGGFYSSPSCPSSRWYFDQCPSCQCNGHSPCHPNTSICIQCQNGTTGSQCQYCEDMYYGDTINGQNTCTACNCNQYNPTCDNRTGNCVCLDSGVTGSRCTQCAPRYKGDAFNFCYELLMVGYIYTLTSDPGTQLTQAYYVVAAEGDVLNFKLEVTDNPLKNDITLQLFLGRLSEKFLLLYNVSYYTIHGTGSYSISLPNDSTPDGGNVSELFTFARPSITESANFSLLLSQSSISHYTGSLWDGDVKLVVYLSGLPPSCQYKISIDNQSYWVLLYFFASFTGCFTILLIIFIVGWYVRRRIAIRAYMRQQYVELQRRVSRPFARVKLEINKTSDLSAPQMPSYAAVEILKDGRAGILTVFVKLPGNQSTNKPNPGRTGVCLGSTLVKLNPSKRDKRSKPKSSSGHVTTNF